MTARRAAPPLALAAAGLLVVSLANAAARAGSREAALVVFAAASLSEPFRALEPAFRAAHPETPVQTHFAASSTLAFQLAEGAAADLIASADARSLEALVRAGRLEAPVRFACNRLEIVVERGNPARVAGLADLARDDLVVVLAAPAVPAGRYAREALAAAGVRVAPRSHEANVKAVLSKVALGEADAGIVYHSDVRAAGARVQGIAFAEAEQVAVSYWVAAVRDARHADAARAWIALLDSAAGRAALADAGFAPP